jgi:hypothetical protein
MGSDKSFKTNPIAPVVQTNAATAVGATQATLQGTVNPEGSSTTYTFDYGTTPSYGSQQPMPAASAGSGASAQPESTTLTGLTPGTAYHFRIEATNSTGTTLGGDKKFTTSSAPAATTDPPTGISSTGATLNATVNPNGFSTTYHFEYGTTLSYGTMVPVPAGNAGTGASDVPVSASITRLTPGATYHFRIDATNTNGTTTGDDRTFVAADRPSATTGTATSVTGTGSTLNGTVNPKGVDTVYHFDYGPTTAYGNSTSEQDAGSGSSSTPASSPLDGLSNGTTYHFRIVATNSSGTAYGTDHTFTTLSPPSATTSAASSVTKTGATLNGVVNPKGQDTQYQFEYGLHTSYGSTTSLTDAGSGSSDVPVGGAISGLRTGTTYHYRIVATNGTGTTDGSDVTFTTAAAPLHVQIVLPASETASHGRVPIGVKCLSAQGGACITRIALSTLKPGTAANPQYVKIGSESVSVPVGTEETVKVPLNDRGLRLLKREGELRVHVLLTATDMAAHSVTRKGALTVRAPK